LSQCHGLKTHLGILHIKRSYLCQRPSKTLSQVLFQVGPQNNMEIILEEHVTLHTRKTQLISSEYYGIYRGLGFTWSALDQSSEIGEKVWETQENKPPIKKMKIREELKLIMICFVKIPFTRVRNTSFLYCRRSQSYHCHLRRPN